MLDSGYFQDVGLALRTLLATVDETLPQLPASTHREVRLILPASPVQKEKVGRRKVRIAVFFFLPRQIEMAQKLLNSDLAELIAKMKLAQQYVMTRYIQW